MQANGGFTLISSTIAHQTNEGKYYRRDSPVKGPFTDAWDNDAGWYTVNGSDTLIQINMGVGASGSTRGRLANTDRPSFYTNTCIIMATYRVQVYATYNQKINWGGGAITYKDGSNMRIVNFKNDSLVVYASPGLCSSSLSSNNQVGIESNGTFGTALPKDRGTSPAVLSYIYEIFNASNPQDYEYGITNNTSGINTINQALAKPNANRVHNLWDITGDHTGVLTLQEETLRVILQHRSVLPTLVVICWLLMLHTKLIRRLDHRLPIFVQIPIMRFQPGSRMFAINAALIR